MKTKVINILQKAIYSFQSISDAPTWNDAYLLNAMNSIEHHRIELLKAARMLEAMRRRGRK